MHSGLLSPAPAVAPSPPPPSPGRAEPPRDAYERGRDRCARELDRLERRASRLATARLAVAAAALALLGAVVWWAAARTWAAAGLVVAAGAFAALVVVHARVHDAMDRASAALRFHQRGLARMAHDWDALPAGTERFRSPEHPFTCDLDVFGRASLMQLLDVTETRFGQERLAALLSDEDPGGMPGGWPAGLLERQSAARDLASRFSFREDLATAGGVLAVERPDAGALLDWAEARVDPAAPNLAPAALAWFGWGVPLVGFAALTSAVLAGAPSALVTAIVVCQLAAGIAVGAKLARVLAAVSAREGAVTRWRAMIARVEAEPFEAPLLARLRARLAGDARAAAASEGLAALERIVSFADARQSDVFRLFIGPFLMWEVHCVAALTRWRARHGARVRGWLDALGEVEALSGVAAFAFEHPEFAWPAPAARAAFEGRAVGHPLIADESRVGNDVSLPSGGRVLVVTGSNMSGKSTLLRAIGVNAVLAFAGAPVCARSLSIGAARVATSMRVEDSLEGGVSHFMAELKRLARVLDRARVEGAAPVLFLLDEILHGTNSRERVIGACAVVRELVERGSLGAVSTHDLGITAIAQELGGRAENVHFEEQVTGETMTFDYVLRRGVVESSNALRLMRAMGIVRSERE